MPKILLCADSFGTTDPRYPGLHFSEKIQQKVKDCEIINLSQSGGSNFLIELQLHQGLRFKPDAVILLFTSTSRLTFQSHLSRYFRKKLFTQSKHNKRFDQQYYWSNIKNYNAQTYLCSPQIDMFGTDNDDFAQRAKKYCLDGFLLEQNYINDLKDYFTVINLLNLCKLNSIPYCFSLGGISWNRPLHKHFRTHVLTDNHLTDELDDHMTQSIDLNLWDYANHSEGPRFHVNDHDVQLQFANECIGKLKL
jgi:hypothetical protein